LEQFKSFNENFESKGFKYEVDKEYVGEIISENLLEVLETNNRRFAKVTQVGKTFVIEAEVTLAKIVESFVKFRLSRGTSIVPSPCKGGIAISLGFQDKAKGDKGSWIVLAEISRVEGQEDQIKDVKTALVDGVVILEDTFYTLVGGEFVRCED
jgi:hypothetical protein